MSEKEKNRRNIYKKNREKWIFAQAVIIGVITIAIIISSIVTVQLDKTYYINYTESGSIDYNVFLKDNEFFEENHLGKDQSYVASLVDKIVTDFYYEMDMDTDDVNFRYSYSVKSRLEIIDDTSGVAIFNPEYELVEVNDKSQSSSSRLKINEIVVLNYDEYNDLANNFIETYALKNTTSNIVLTFEVDVLSDCKSFTGSSIETYKSELRIPLTTQTVNIKMKSNVPDAESQMIACTRGMGSEVFKTTAIVLGVVDAFLILLLVAFIYLTRTSDITYNARIKRIVTQYKSYIQKIRNLFDTSTYQVIMVEEFDELLEIRDTIQAPILMYENENKTSTKFMIPTDSKLLYIYEIKIDGFEETPVEPQPQPTPPPAPQPAPEPAPTRKPVYVKKAVRSVKVVVAPVPEDAVPFNDSDLVDDEPLYDTVEAFEKSDSQVAEQPVSEIIEEPVEEIIEEPVEEIVEEVADEAAVEAVEEAAEELVEEVVEEEYPEGYVDAIDVRWEESRNKTYKYDPDGHRVGEGDVVLVPTRDEHSDKEVVREAQVARGNYKVDPASLEHPLKKIIGVVKRRAEKVFTTMITPDEN